VNTDDSSVGSPGIAAIGGIFRDHRDESWELSLNIGHQNALSAVFHVVMFTIEKHMIWVGENYGLNVIPRWLFEPRSKFGLIIKDIVLGDICTHIYEVN